MRRGLLSALLLVALAAAPALAAPAPKTSLAELEEQVMCVVCKTPLSVAGGPQADAQRTEIRRLVAQGLTAQQVKDALVAEYGERVLAVPQDDGFDLAAYLVPIAAVALALTLLAVMLPRWRRGARARAAETPAALGPELSADDARRLDEDLARYD